MTMLKQVWHCPFGLTKSFRQSSPAPYAAFHALNSMKAKTSIVITILKTNILC
jgi:hypothetical protein